jgi:hypothetical protein
VIRVDVAMASQWFDNVFKAVNKLTRKFASHS